MVVSFLKLVALAAALHAPAQQSTPQRRTESPIVVDAASGNFDYRNNVIVLPDVRITQGDIEVRADQATATATAAGPDVENGEWVFRGNVRITAQTGFLRSDEARVNIVSGRISHALIKGSPAQFEQQLTKPADESGGVARGHADTIEYDVASATVRLQDNASLTYGGTDIHTQTIVYSISEEKILANPHEQGQERVHITIDPKTLQKPDETTPQKPPQ